MREAEPQLRRRLIGHALLLVILAEKIEHEQAEKIEHDIGAFL
jgi:hypothetical protein